MVSHAGQGIPSCWTEDAIVCRSCLVWIVLVWGVATSAGCAKQRTGDEALAALEASLDEGWRPGALPERGLPPGITPDRLEADRDRLQAAASRWPGAPSLAWREARVMIGLGLAEEHPVSARRWWAKGRDVAIACVQSGAHQLPDVDQVASLPPARVPCAAWAADAWTRWATTWDRAATTVDRASVAALVDGLGRLLLRPEETSVRRAASNRALGALVVPATPPVPTPGPSSDASSDTPRQTPPSTTDP